MDDNWRVFVNNFYDAFVDGDISALVKLKNTQSGFNNIDDLGGISCVMGQAWENGAT